MKAVKGTRANAPADATHATTTDLLHMRRALVLAQGAAAVGEVPVGAVIYETLSGKLIAESANTRETRRDPAGHAEFSAILAAARARKDWRLSDCTLVVTLEPCAMCAMALMHARFKRVVFAATDPKTGAAGSVTDLFAEPRLNHHTAVQGGVLADASSRLLRDFFAERRQEQRAARQAASEPASGSTADEPAIPTGEAIEIDHPSDADHPGHTA